MANKEEQARREGMCYALEYAKKYGIEKLEEECRMRGLTKLPLKVPRSALDECVNNIKQTTLSSVLILSCVTLRDQFSFGRKRIQEFVDRFNKKSECLSEDYTTWEEQMQILREECGIELELVKNDKDVKI